jgi:hypothetical protein
MSSISIIGLGTYARAIGTRGVEAGAGLLMMGLAGHGAGYNIALGVDPLG